MILKSLCPPHCVLALSMLMVTVLCILLNGTAKGSLSLSQLVTLIVLTNESRWSVNIILTLVTNWPSPITTREIQKELFYSNLLKVTLCCTDRWI